jgi:epoxyqueuosine reductase
MTATATVLGLAHQIGFDEAAVVPLGPPPDLGRFDDWLAAGRHGDMAWLARYRDRIADPAALLPQGRSMLVVALGHSRPAVRLEDGSRVARYAAGRDYHNVVGRKLRRLRARLVEAGLMSPAAAFRKVVDAGPLLERSYGAQAGLGFSSKAANLLHPRLGPWFFLGELLLEVELEPTPALPMGSCGTCRLCLDACPTGAIVAPCVVDARACLSYQTIENRGPIPVELRAALGPWAFGCDVCSEVCPWGSHAPDLSARFGTHRALEGGAAAWLGTREEAEFAERTRGSPLKRPGRAGLARNAAIVLGNLPGEGGREALGAALDEDSSSLVREAAAWALMHGYSDDEGVRAQVERASIRENDAAVAACMRAGLGGETGQAERSTK